ncbi:MAG: hypothetical protein JNJ61_16745, partial [Anaerolineae bacterium]|nr:hypothetical protein [Anaerolineae bacterium]
MYKPRPTVARERLVFDHCLRSRLGQLGADDALLLLCDSAVTLDSLRPLLADFPHLPTLAMIINPHPWSGRTPDTPTLLGWETSDQWRRCQTTDRWARIDAALAVAAALAERSPGGYLVMPALDAVWGRGLLPRLRQLSERGARNGLPAAVSPYTYHQHAAVPGADIPPDVIHLLNTAFGRDTLFGWKLRLGRVQTFWGKMSLLPIRMCATVRAQVDQSIWEDDREIDRVISEQGYGTRGLWVRDPRLYHQALPVFDRDGVRRVIERTLHYSLHIPGDPIGGSALTEPLDALGRLRCIVRPRFARYNA